MQPDEMNSIDHDPQPRRAELSSRCRFIDRKSRHNNFDDGVKARRRAEISRRQPAAIYDRQYSALAPMGYNGMLQQPHYALPHQMQPPIIPSQATYTHPYLNGYIADDERYGPAVIPPVLHHAYPPLPGYGVHVPHHVPDAMIHPSAPPVSAVPPPACIKPASYPPLTRRGPPHKPKRSGHACWVGNILRGDPKWILKQLKDLFSDGFTGDIESVSYMDRTGCAFVNYRTQEACDDAIRVFNGTVFNGSRLLCRAKRDTSGEDLALAAQPLAHERKDSRALGIDADKLSDLLSKVSCAGVSEEEAQPSNNDATEEFQEERKVLTDRYFILKSLTQEDLEDSRVEGMWTTQSHVQKVLHAAYQESENVYLVFSVNKSGAYYGYAKMLSSPLDGPTSEDTAKCNAAEGVAISNTAATETAQRGRIVDDPARATLFWEADRNPEDGDISEEHSPRKFRVEWLRIRAINFYQVRGMRNPWNGHKDVKVARDGTELETSIGQRIIRMFEEDCDGAYEACQPHSYVM